MFSIKKRLARERLTMSKMVGIYCAAHHDSGEDNLCGSCREFLNYAERRLRKCPYGNEKPAPSEMPLWERKTDLRQLSRALLQTGAQGAGSRDHAIRWPPNVIAPSTTRYCPPAGWFSQSHTPA